LIFFLVNILPLKFLSQDFKDIKTHQTHIKSLDFMMVCDDYLIPIYDVNIILKADINIESIYNIIEKIKNNLLYNI